MVGSSSTGEIKDSITDQHPWSSGVELPIRDQISMVLAMGGGMAFQVAGPAEAKAWRQKCSPCALGIPRPRIPVGRLGDIRVKA